MTQRPLLWVEVSAHAVRKKSYLGGIVWAGAGVCRVALVGVLSLSLKTFRLPGIFSFLCVKQLLLLGISLICIQNK
jgi:hypothetical protein